jgi:hypothetical protein
MADFKPLVDALVKDAPLAIYAGLIGVIWQLVYVMIRDRISRKEAAERLRFESEKFDHQSRLELFRFERQRELERQKFEYDKLKWRETLALELAKRHLDARLEAYPELWFLVRAVAKHRESSLDPKESKDLADAIERWRYGKGGLLAEETTRDAAIALQSALWKFDSTSEGFKNVRAARRLVRAALRADMGLGPNGDGETIFDATAERQRIGRELAALAKDLDILGGSK